MLEIDRIDKLSYLTFVVKTFLKFYPWKNCAPKIHNSHTKELNESNVAIVSSAGLSINNIQKGFNEKKYEKNVLNLVTS